ncbi:ribonuclease domain-containing protein [Nocardioides sp. S-58]|uniref:Ribonuclease domain-containing protein n=1 Tax=Nocardioides renjunii TaxID=3095075 RepID=A0ABU5KFN1_9ACTN|nr:ribonuclease domain-containing protein [Nocardioides sp. S-58]MDZ5663777.1 ribonuclease domain-containing protein [Nocardioides sp. S-58]
MAASAGRRRYRWLVLLVAAAILLVSMFIPADRDGTDSGAGAEDATSESASEPDFASPTVTATPTRDSTTFPATPPPSASGGTDPGSGLPVVRLDDLPPEAARTVEAIADGPPFPEDRDGVTFENREELLPDRARGYYREFTVPTPGSSDRGARRIVAGQGGELYWTADHYRSFSRIAGSP